MRRGLDCGIVARGLDRFGQLSRKAHSRLVRRLALACAVSALGLPAAVLGALPADVATVAGKPIKRQVVTHWMFVEAKSSNGPDAVTIVPTDPPRFTRCVAQVRAAIPSLRKTPTSALRADCAVLFTNLSRHVLDFLIRADWQDQQAATDGIVVSAAQIEHAYQVGRRRNYPSPAQFRRYLRRTGETIADVKFRFRVHLIHEALLQKEHLSGGALDAELTRRFKPRTACARFYVMSDCAN